MAKKYSRQDIQRFLDQEDLCYQKIDLPYGLSTPGRTHSSLRKKATAYTLQGCQGKTVLDIGSFLGYFSFKAQEHGAKKVVGLEINKKRCRQANIIAKLKGVDHCISFKHTDVDQGLNTKEKYDVVLCLNVLHRIHNPFNLLDQLADMTKEKMIITFAGFGDDDRKLLNTSSWIKKCRNSPVIWAQPGSYYLPGDKSYTYFFSLPALKTLLLYKKPVFAKIEAINAGYKKRQTIIAHKRQIDHLIIVAGPASSGKQKFITNLKKGNLPAITKKLGGVDLSHTDAVDADQIFFYKKPKVNTLILKYETGYPVCGDTASEYFRDPVLEILTCTKKTSVITLHCEPEDLQRSFIQKELGGKKAKISPSEKLYQSLPGFLQKAASASIRFIRRKNLLKKNIRGHEIKERNKRLKQFFSNDKNIKEMYTKWNIFCKKRVHKHLTYNVSKQKLQ